MMSWAKQEKPVTTSNARYSLWALAKKAKGDRLFFKELHKQQRRTLKQKYNSLPPQSIYVRWR
jgi:hypothetical protein